MIQLKAATESFEHGNLNFLEEYKFPNGKPFPKSYKQFVETYGYGLSLGLFIIYIPMGDHGDSWNVRTEEIKGTYIDDVLNDDIWFNVDPDGSVDLVKEWIPFAASENGHYLFWDSNSGADQEMDIYITDFRGIGIRKAGKSLWDVFEQLTDKEKFRNILPFSQEPLTRTFQPYTVS